MNDPSRDDPDDQDELSYIDLDADPWPIEPWNRQGNLGDEYGDD